jgi:lipid A 3-O-deacylase
MFPKKGLKSVSAGLSLLFFTSAVYAFDSASVEYGTGNETQVIRIGLQDHWNRQWLKTNGIHLSGYWDLSLGYWRGHKHQNIDDNIQSLADLGITPVFRIEADDKRGLYGEAGVGAHLLSEHYNNNGRELSTNFQFGSHVGVGYVFPNGIDVGVRAEHISNAGIKEPNSGVNYGIVRVSYPF